MEETKTKTKIPETPQLAGAEKKPEERKVDPAKEARKWNDRYDTAMTHQRPMFDRWSKWYNDMYAHIHNPQMAPWRSKVYLPILASKTWDLISRFIQYRPGWDVSIRTLPVNTLSKKAYEAYVETMSKNVEKVKMKLDYDYDNAIREVPIQDELLGVMLDAAVTGQGLGRVPYCTKNSEYRSYWAEGDSLDYSKVVRKDAKEGYNDFSAVNIFNLFITPGATDLQKAPWLIIHEFKPLYELRNDPQIDQSAIPKLKTKGLTNDTAVYEKSRNRLVTTQDTTTLDDTVEKAEIFECWDKETNELVIYGLGTADSNSKWVELRRSPNMYWHKKYPFVPFYIRRKPYQFHGESLFENSETLQAAMNDIFNHFMDAHNMADGMIAIEEGAVVEPYIIEPGGELRYRGEMPKQFRFTPPDAAGMQTAMNLVTGAIENATISQYASGIPNSSTDTTQGTATGVTRLMEAAAEKVGFMRANFRRSWREVGQMWLSNSQQFMKTDAVYEEMKDGKKEYTVIRPIDLLGIWGIKIDDGSFEPVSKDEKRRNYLDYVANVSAWQQSSIAQAEISQDTKDVLRLDWNEIMKRGSEHFGENASSFIMPMPEPQPEPAPAPAEQPPAQPQPMSYEDALAGLV